MSGFSVEILSEQELKSLSPDDVRFEQVLKLDNEFFDWPWSKDNWFKFFDSSRNFSLCVLTNSNNDLNGFCLFEHFLLDGGSHLYKILVSPEHRGTGAADTLLKGHCEFLKSLGLNSIYLEVAVDNSGAIRFYEKRGMTRGVIKKKFYADGRDAVVMTGSI